MKADHNTITLFGVKVMWKYKVSKHERGVIKTQQKQIKNKKQKMHVVYITDACAPPLLC